MRDTDSDPETPGYAQNLDDPANSRKIAKFIRDTKKPKSILLSNNTSRLNKVPLLTIVSLDNLSSPFPSVSKITLLLVSSLK